MSLRQMQERADSVLQALQGSENARKLQNAASGWSLVIGRQGRKKMGKNPNIGRLEAIAVSKLPELIAIARLVETHADTKHNNVNVEAIHRLAAPMRVDGVDYVVKFTVKDYVLTDGTRRTNLHALEVLHQ